MEHQPLMDRRDVCENHNMELAELGTRIARARELAGVSQTSLGDALGVDRSAISRMEKGDRKVSVPEMLTIAERLERPLSYFMSEAVPSVVSRRSDSEGAHESNALLDEELRAFSSDVADMLERGLISGTDRGSFAFRTPHSHDDAELAARKIRDLVGVGLDAPILDLGRFCDDLGLLMYTAALTQNGPDGACVEVGDPGNQLGVAVINGEAPHGRRRMTLAHELGHWLTGDAYDTDASRDAERMLNSFAIHLLAPRPGLIRVRDSRRAWSTRDKAIAIGAEFQLSWSTAISQMLNVNLIDHTVREQLSRNVPRAGEFARLGFEVPRTTPTVRLSPRFVSSVLEAYTTERLTSARTLELLRGTLAGSDLPVLPTEVRSAALVEAFKGHNR